VKQTQNVLLWGEVAGGAPGARMNGKKGVKLEQLFFALEQGDDHIANVFLDCSEWNKLHLHLAYKGWHLENDSDQDGSASQGAGKRIQDCPDRRPIPPEGHDISSNARKNLENRSSDSNSNRFISEKMEIKGKLAFEMNLKID
jgi:hypothetical protein